MKLANYRARRFVVVMGMCGVRTDNMCSRKLIFIDEYLSGKIVVYSSFELFGKKFSMLYHWILRIVLWIYNVFINIFQLFVTNCKSLREFLLKRTISLFWINISLVPSFLSFIPSFMFDKIQRKFRSFKLYIQNRLCMLSFDPDFQALVQLLSATYQYSPFQNYDCQTFDRSIQYMFYLFILNLFQKFFPCLTNIIYNV